MALVVRLVFVLLLLILSHLCTGGVRYRERPKGMDRENGQRHAYPLSEIQECVTAAMKGRRFMRKTEKALHLDFGDPAIEMFNVLSSHDVKQVEALDSCVRSHAPEMFVDRQGLPLRNFTHGGSNITFLTGAFQQVLPEILDKIISSAHQPMLEGKQESAGYWFSPLRGLGVRSVQFLSFINIKAKLTKEQRREIRYAKFLAERDELVWIGKPRPDLEFVEDENEEEEEEEWFDEHADENLAPYINNEQADTDSLYLATVLLSDRYHFSGGEMYIKREREEPAAAKEKGEGEGGGEGGGAKQEGEGEEGDDGYDDDNEDVGEVVAEKLVGIAERKKVKSFPVYNARTSKVGRYTPEKGSVLLMRGDYPRGMGALHRGKRLCLVVEFWPYADSPAGSTRPTAKEAMPLPQRWEL